MKKDNKSDFERVAQRPASGDVVVLRGGEIIYAIDAVAVESGDDGQAHYVVSVVRRHGNKVSEVEIDGDAWSDLVMLAAATVRPASD